MLRRQVSEGAAAPTETRLSPGHLSLGFPLELAPYVVTDAGVVSCKGKTLGWAMEADEPPIELARKG